MHVKKLRFFLFVFLLVQGFVLHSQSVIKVDYKNVPLKQVLEDLEPQTGLLFSYSDELVRDRSISLKMETSDVAALLNILAKTANLNFERIGANQVIITSVKSNISVCGYLFDGISKTPLAYATLLIKGTLTGFTTDENGYFSLEDVNLDKGLLLQYIGYASKILETEDFELSTCKNFYLFPKVETLQEVIVKSYLITGIDKNKDGSIGLNSEELGILPGLVEPDIFQSVQWAPGITSINETVSDIQIRGGSADQNLILYDGIKMYNTGHFFGMLSIFNPYTTTGATIFKSGASAEYGDRISGIIDIAGETQIPERTNFGLGFNGTQADVYSKIRLGDKVGLVLSGRRSYVDLLGNGTPTFDAISEKVFQNTIVDTGPLGQIEGEEDEETLLEGEETFFFYDTNIKLLIKPSEKDSLSVTGLLTRNDLFFRLLDDENISQDALVSENEGLSFNWSGVKANRWHHSLEGYYSNYNSNYRNVFLEEQTAQEESVRRNSVKDYGIQTAIEYDFSVKHALKLGYQISKNEVFYQLFRDEAGTEDIDPEDSDEDGEESADERDFNEISNRVNTTNAIYGTYSFRPKNRGLLSLGIRASKFSLLNNWYLEPRLNLEYPVNRILRLKVTAERRYQTLSQLIEFDDTRLRLQSGTWTLTDQDLIPLLESNQYSAGALLDFNGWTIDLDAYIKNIDGLTSFTNGFTNASEEYSQGTSDIFGMDFLLKKQLGNYRIWIGYTYNTVDYNFAELSTTKFSGNNDITHNLTLSNTYETAKWKFSLGWNYRTGAPFTPVQSFNPTTGDLVFGAINSRRLPDYHRLDASALYGFKIAKNNALKGEVGVSFQNIYARQVPLSVFYREDENPITGLPEIEQLEQLSLGLTPNFVFRLNF
ncbi:TonB-dependent receptor [Croceivirga thetidis]|uniref:TonB-dependent receptor plug domain-containing protein n=1 Tax=Croceivirga thetidis TaxID=2721623 RepID=A0ABX1GRV5_9FLAO|nr:TonB-dependent receptor [Croceivirga thetidis]NKI31796.1 TonB-dependent receptor plug domain-containing protein [Croceivirga thetidis]